MDHRSEFNDTYQRRTTLLLMAALLVLFAVMIHGFLITLLLAAIFSGLLYPLYDACIHGSKPYNNRYFCAISIIALACVAVGLPVALLGKAVISEASQLQQALQNIVENGLPASMDTKAEIKNWIPFYHYLQPYESELYQRATGALATAGNWLVSSLSSATQNAIVLAIKFFVLLYAMFFFLLYGPTYLRHGEALLPMEAGERHRVVQKGLSVTRATLKSIFVIGILQGVLMGAAFWVAGLPGAVLWGTVVAVLSAIPGLGAPIVWVPAALYLISQQQVAMGIAMLIWGVVVVSSVDNVLRPWIVGRDAKMSDLLILVSTLGGISFFGPVGIIVGPVIASAMLTSLTIYRHVFRDVLADF